MCLMVTDVHRANSSLDHRKLRRRLHFQVSPPKMIYVAIWLYGILGPSPGSYVPPTSMQAEHLPGAVGRLALLRLHDIVGRNLAILQDCWRSKVFLGIQNHSAPMVARASSKVVEGLYKHGYRFRYKHE